MRQRLSPRFTTAVGFLGIRTAGDNSSERDAAVAIRGRSRLAAAGDRSKPALEATSFKATATLCFEITCCPFGRLDLSVSSYSPGGSLGGTIDELSGLVGDGLIISLAVAQQFYNDARRSPAGDSHLGQ